MGVAGAPRVTLALPLAESFASTPSGYIVGVGLPIIATIILTMLARQERRRSTEQAKVWEQLDALKTALTVNTQALAVLVQQATDDRPSITRVPRLDTALTVLRDRMDRHEKWAEGEHTRLRDAYEIATRPRPTQGATP